MAKKIKYVGSKAVNKDSLSSFSTFNDSYQTTIFNGDIKLSTKFSTDTNISREKKIIITQKNVSLSDLKITDLDGLNNFIKVTNRLKLNIDKTNLSNYAVYGSLKEKYRVAINNIINKFPGGLFLNTYVSGTPYNNVLDYNYDQNSDTSSFKIPITVIENPFFINLSVFNSNNSKNIDNLVERYLDYTLLYNGLDYGISGFTGFTTGNSSYLYFTILGNPFGDFSSATVSDNFVIKPNDIEFNKFYDSLNELERYFLSKNSKPKYSFSFKIPEVDEDGNLTFKEYKFNFPIRYDGYNLDTESVNYVIFLEKLFEIGDLYDEYKSNLILRKLIPKTLIDLDVTNSYKSESMFKIYGKEIDEIKMFIDSLMSINSATYDKINNIPDTLIKNLARTLSWKARNIINDKDLVASVFANDRSGDTDIIASLAEVDIELWRRITINTAWFMKSKGTRKSIETIFSFIGAPDCLVVFDEHVYVVDGKINPKLVDPSILINPNTDETVPIPYDDDGYPIAPRQTSTIYFQKNGNEDSGQFYIDLYRKLGFDVTKTVDNKKSWVYYESASTHSSSGRNTNYDVADSRLIINTKEVSISLDIATAIECDVYNFNKTNNYPVTTTGRTVPYPQRESNKFDANSLTFAQYVNKIYSTFINAQNRKVSDSAIGSYYPSLTKLYYDYLDESFNDIGVVSNRRRFIELLDYVDNLDLIFDDFVRQFIPATTIFTEGGLTIRNTVFTPQKFVYKQGIDDGSEFSSDVPFTPDGDVDNSDDINVIVIETEIFDTYEETLNVATISTEVKASDNNGSIDTDYLTSVRESKNIEFSWDGSFCETEIPMFSITGATKIALSSLTNNSIYNKSTGTGHTVSFNFTSATETLTASTTEFYFGVHRFDKSTGINGFQDAPIYVFSATSTAFTSSTLISGLITDSSLRCDSEYIVKPYFLLKACAEQGQIFTAITPYNMYEQFIYSGYNRNYRNSPRFFDYTKFSLSTGLTISSLVPNTNYTPLFRNYNQDSDYYFVSTCIPDQPILNLPNLPDSQGLIVESFVIGDTVNNPPSSSYTTNTLSIQYEPIGDIVVAVNGITLFKNTEYFVDNNSGLPPSIGNRKINFIEPLLANTAYTDVVTITYSRDTGGTTRLVKEDFQYTGSTEITLNPITGRYEISLNYQRIPNSDVGVYFNGVFLAENLDYQISTFNQNTIVLASGFVPPDPSLFSVFYLTNSGPTGQVIQATQPHTVSWTISNPIPFDVTGNFIHEFYDITNTGLTGTSVYSADTAYIPFLNSFSKTFDWTTITALTYGNSYLYRIGSNKIFKTINNINLNSTIYSSIYTIQLPV